MGYHAVLIVIHAHYQRRCMQATKQAWVGLLTHTALPLTKVVASRQWLELYVDYVCYYKIFKNRLHNCKVVYLVSKGKEHKVKTEL